VLEPQSTAFFVLLMVVFGALLVWLVVTKQVVFRVLAACLAFIPAMVFGVAAVNKYYDYYQTWGAAFNDLTGQSAQGIPKVSEAGLGVDRGLGAAIGMQSAALDAQAGLVFQTTVTGPVSRISRTVFIYLPPQYFQKQYQHYRFPAILLLHGSPGQPETWVNVLGVIPTYQNLLAARKAAPAVLVMPDTNGGLQYGLQCLNDPGGLQDMTFVAREVPAWVSTHLRVSHSGRAWGVAGYSEGGFCAANIGLLNPGRFAFVGVMSGYFAPVKSQVPEGNKPNGKPHDINDFAGNPRLQLMNTPDKYIQHIPAAVEIPQFFLAAGAADPGDVQALLYFRQLLQLRQPVVPYLILPGAGHQAKVWRAALVPMFSWMTPYLQQAAMAKPTPARPPLVVKGHHPSVNKTPVPPHSTTQPPARKP
jgi:enterochelin esterase-like enzyme